MRNLEAIGGEAGSRLIADRLRAIRRPANRLFGHRLIDVVG